MHAFNHAAVGGAAAAVTLRLLHPLEAGQSGPSLADPSAWALAAIVFGGGFIIHAAMDMAPHDDRVFPLWGEMLLGGLCLGGCYLLTRESYGWLIVVGALGGAGPDLEHIPYQKGWLPRRFFPTHNETLPHRASLRAFNLAVQLPLFVASMLVIARWG